MQRLEQAVAVFCTACICAELAVQFVGEGWGRRCIKMVAGLYILVVFIRMLPAGKLEMQAFSVPQAEAASFGSFQELVASETKRQMEQELQQQWKSGTGISMDLNLTLLEQEKTVIPVHVQAFLPESCTQEQQQAAADFLQTTLGLSESQVEIFSENGEAFP